MEKYRLQTTETFEKDFRRLDIQTRKKIDKTVKKLETNPKIGRPLKKDI